MNTTSIGRDAESLASEYLAKSFNFKLIAKNWRTRTCEIDLIMQSAPDDQPRTIHFIEVKYRKTDHFGGGIDSINKSKLKRMYGAALEWLEQNSAYSGYQINISAIEITGPLKPSYTYIDSVDYDF